MDKTENKANIDILYRQFSNYKSWVAIVKTKNEELKVLNDKKKSLESISAIQYDKERSQNSLSQDSILISIVSKIDAVEAERNLAVYQIKYLETLLELLEMDSDEETMYARELIKFRLMERHSWDKCKRKFFKGNGSMEYDIRKALGRLVS